MPARVGKRGEALTCSPWQATQVGATEAPFFALPDAIFERVAAVQAMRVGVRSGG
jgi:hypothetical protein